MNHCKPCNIWTAEYDMWGNRMNSCRNCGMAFVNCSSCGGLLLGTEIELGTCGHCGGRSLIPERNRRWAQLRASYDDADVALLVEQPTLDGEAWA